MYFLGFCNNKSLLHVTIVAIIDLVNYRTSNTFIKNSSDCESKRLLLQRICLYSDIAHSMIFYR